MKTIILAGGFGTRLSEYTEAIPKPMVAVGGKPILWHIMRTYAYFNHNDFFVALGYKADLRDYGVGAQILRDIGVRKIRLMTNNPKKIVGLEGYGLAVVERVPIETHPHPRNVHYLKVKKNKLGHMLEKV